MQEGWLALHEFRADERAPVCRRVQDACVRLCGHPGQSDRLLTPALHWMDSDDREPQLGVVALTTEIFGKKTTLANLADKSGLREFLTRVLAVVPDAPRSASRLDSYRRLPTALPGRIAACVASAGATSPLAQATQAWLKNEFC